MTGGTSITVGGAALTLDPSGAVWWPDKATLVVADLHFEKGSAFAARGSLLPPYDTRATLRRLASVIGRLRPRRVVCLGDSFHDGGAGGRIDPADADAVRELAAAHDWLWIAGNHDPAPPAALGGAVRDAFELDGLTFRHCAVAAASAELSGHYHPKAFVTARGKRVWRGCFVEDGRRLVLPAFGVYAGGLDVTDPAFAPLFPDGFTAHLLVRDRLFSFASTSAAFA
jgi:DNA ligase-associated metallophosphoesterase